MGCLIVLLSLISARLALLVLWIFTDFVDRAYDTWIVPLLGLLLLPWTTLIYALAWAPGRGVSPLGWFCVALGFIADLGSMGRAGTERRARYA
jgi:hypothetical protein